MEWNPSGGFFIRQGATVYVPFLIPEKKNTKMQNNETWWGSSHRTSASQRTRYHLAILSLSCCCMKSYTFVAKIFSLDGKNGTHAYWQKSKRAIHGSAWDWLFLSCCTPMVFTEQCNCNSVGREPWNIRNFQDINRYLLEAARAATTPVPPKIDRINSIVARDGDAECYTSRGV